VTDRQKKKDSLKMQSYRVLPSSLHAERQAHLQQQATAMLKSNAVPPSIVVDLLPPQYHSTVEHHSPKQEMKGNYTYTLSYLIPT
jgi:hypothetical protein